MSFARDVPRGMSFMRNFENTAGDIRLTEDADAPEADWVSERGPLIRRLEQGQMIGISETYCVESEEDGAIGAIRVRGEWKLAPSLNLDAILLGNSGGKTSGIGMLWG